MASNVKKPSPTHFFKIISDQSLHEGKLMIPRAFVEKYGEGLPKTVFLKKPPNDAEWELDLVKCDDGKVWFQKGWKQFAEHHSLAHGHLLLFSYAGTSHFQLRIFGMNGLEINYPSETVHGKRDSIGKGNKPSNDEKSEDYRAGQKRKAKFSLEVPQSCKMGSSSKCVKVGNALKLRKGALPDADERCKGKQVITAKQVTALDRASSFKTRKPSFRIFMHPSYVTRCEMSLPVKFCLRHLDLSKGKGDINLRVVSGRVWTAKYIIRKWDGGEKIILLSSGWRAFVKDNNLKVGDLCIFQLIVKTNNTFKVHIFRESDNVNCSTSQESVEVDELVKD